MKLHELKYKDINLLDALQKDKEPSKYLPYLKIWLPPVLLSLVIGALFTVVAAQNHFLRLDIESIQKETQALQEATDVNPNVELYETWLATLDEVTYYEELYKDIESYPKLKEGTFTAIANSEYGGIKVIAFNYERESQNITLQIEASSANGAEIFVRRLKDTDIFADVKYSGYQQSEKVSPPSQKSEITEESDAEKVLEYVKEQIENNTVVKNTTYTVYNATVLCTLK